MKDIGRFRSIPFVSGKKVYFASDFHLGVPHVEESLKREKYIIKWLELIKRDASAIFLVGDLFDFWFEYSKVIPKGFVRFQGKIAELSDAGIEIHFCTGNHDLWVKDYFIQELGVTIHREPIQLEIGTKKFFISHGDGLGKGDSVFKVIRWVFRSGLAQWLFERLHPNFGVSIAQRWSKISRKKSHSKEEVPLGEKERLFQYCKSIEANSHHDFYVFGHRHLALEMRVSASSTYFNLGEWFDEGHYLEFDGNHAALKSFAY